MSKLESDLACTLYDVIDAQIARTGVASFSQAAREMDVPASTVARLQRGRLPRLPGLLKILGWLDVKLEDVLPASAPGPALGADVRDWIQLALQRAADSLHRETAHLADWSDQDWLDHFGRAPGALSALAENEVISAVVRVSLEVRPEHAPGPGISTGGRRIGGFAGEVIVHGAGSVLEPPG